MSPEGTIRQMFSTPLPRNQMYCPNCKEQMTGPTLIGEEGERRCPKCGTIAADEHPPALALMLVA